jgi:hypothetical protein
VCAPDFVQRGSDLNVVVGVLVRQHQLSRGHDSARLVSVQPLNLVRPFPLFIGEMEAEPPDPLRRTPGKCLFYGVVARHHVNVNDDTKNYVAIKSFVIRRRVDRAR